MTAPVPPPLKYERGALEHAMVECRRRLEYARAESDDLQVDLLEADLNFMLERYGRLCK